jgi:quinolinate phosphoribosyl transferase, C-terminal domain protein
MKDFRDDIFCKIANYQITACIYTDMDGVISGVTDALNVAAEIGLTVNYTVSEGDEVFSGDLIAEISGTPKQICQAEDQLIGCISKYSGVATAAKKFVEKAGPKMRVVCGSHKKATFEIKEKLRAAIVTGGAHIRISDEPMVYLDKNYVAMFGGIQKALMAVAQIMDRKKAIQIKGRNESGDIVREAWTAVSSGADIVYVDTGNVTDLKLVTDALKPKLKELEETESYRHVEFAFGGGVVFSDMDAIRDAGADIVGVGRAIIDAPLMDLRLEVTDVKDPSLTHDGYNLLDKHELMIQGISLDETNLNELAAVVAEEIGVAPEDTLVIDVRDRAVALDILQSHLDPEKFISKEKTILKRLSQLKGVCLDPGAQVTSNGMLGWIAGDEVDIDQSRQEIARSKEIGMQIMKAVSRRVIVFPTGSEIESGEVEDTNTTLVMQKFSEAGFTAEKGEVLKDDLYLFSGKLRLAAENGYGVSITTGGVGAENKDFSVEAIQLLDPKACTPYIAKFRAGHGRHSKDGIRIGVGQMGLTTYIALPGPNDEVSVCIDTVVKGVSEGWSKEILAHEIAKLLRTRLQKKIGIEHSSVC